MRDGWCDDCQRMDYAPLDLCRAATKAKNESEEQEEQGGLLTGDSAGRFGCRSSTADRPADA